MIFIDTSALAHGLRRRRGTTLSDEAREFGDLLRRGVRLGIPSIVVQEVLSGVRTDEQFEGLLAQLQEQETRDMLYYLGRPGQVPLPK